MLESRTDNMTTGSSTSSASLGTAGPAFDPSAISRPDPLLMKYYFIVALCTVFGFPFAIWPLYVKYRTLRYAFDDKGVSMSYGWLFRKEVYLTYRRIQDIHVSRNIFHRWLGLAAVAVQTASGSSSAEMTIEGITNPEGLRDFLYLKMRGAREGHETAGAAGTEPPKAAAQDEALVLLHEIRDELRAMRESRATNP
jgi:putative membrane protein